MTKRQSGSRNEQSNSQPGKQLDQQDPDRQQGQQGAPTGVGKGGLGNQVNQGQGQQNPRGNPSTGQQTQQDMGGGGQQRGSMNKPGDANESGSSASTRRDDGGMGKGN